MLFSVLFVLAILVLFMVGKKDPKEPPLCPGFLPFIGNPLVLLGNDAQVWKNVKKMSARCKLVGGVCSINVGIKHIYVVTDAEDATTVLNACLQRDEIYDLTKNWLQTSLISARVPVWKVHRKLLNPAFSQAVADGFEEVLNTQARRLVKNISVEVGKGPFDHFKWMGHAALETICLTAFGVDLASNCDLLYEYIKAINEILEVYFERFKKFWWHNDTLYNFSLLKRQEQKLIDTLNRLTDTLMQRRKAIYLNPNAEKDDTLKTVKFKPFLDLIWESARERGGITDEEMRGHIDTMIATGHDTNASTLVFGLVLIGSYPDVQQKIAEELHSVFGTDDRDVTKEDISKLVYLDAALKETLRLYPILPILAREVEKDIKLRNFTLSAGKTCYVFIHDTHRHPSWGPDVEDFRPERWLDGNSASVNFSAYAAFGLGRRSCIGRAYAMMTAKIFLVHLLRNFKINGDHTKMVTKMVMVQKPYSGHNISIDKRI